MLRGTAVSGGTHGTGPMLTTPTRINNGAAKPDKKLSNGGLTELLPLAARILLVRMNILATRRFDCGKSCHALGSDH